LEQVFSNVEVGENERLKEYSNMSFSQRLLATKQERIMDKFSSRESKWRSGLKL